MASTANNHTIESKNVNATVSLSSVIPNYKLKKEESKKLPIVNYEKLFLEKTGKDFNVFYAKYYKKLVNFIKKYSVTDLDAEDIALFSIMHSLEKIEQYNNQWHYSTWLFNIAKKFVYQYKKNMNKLVFIEGYITADDGSTNLDTSYNYIWHQEDMTEKNYDYEILVKEKYNHTLKVITHLDDKYKQIIELRDIQNKSYNEIADLLNVDIQTVKNRLHHGRLKIEKGTKDKFKSLVKTY